VLGGLLYFLMERMRSAPSIEAKQTIKHRMVDFAVTGEAIAQALGMTPGTFITRQADARANAARDWIEGDGFAAPLVAWLQDIGKSAKQVATMPSARALMKKSPWTGLVNGRCVVIAPAKDIYEAVRNRSPDGPYALRNARQTRTALERVQGGLTKAGWSMGCRQTNGGSNAYWVFGAPL